MPVSSRTPEGMPSECPLCGAQTNIEFSEPAGDAPCPGCGCLIWASAQLLQTVCERFAGALGVEPGQITANTQLAEWGVDSLDSVEVVMELEEQWDINLPDHVAERIQTIGDFVRYVQASVPRSDS